MKYMKYTDFDRSIHFVMYKWASGFCFIHMIQIYLMCLLIFDIFHFIFTGMCQRNVFWRIIL